MNFFESSPFRFVIIPGTAGKRLKIYCSSNNNNNIVAARKQKKDVDERTSTA
jgi:hypothetical protein